MDHKQMVWLNVGIGDVFLTVSTCYKEDMGCSVGKLLYGTSLRIPGESFVVGSTTQNTSILLQQLRRTMRILRAVPVPWHVSNKTVFVHPALNTFSHVCLRGNSVGKTLQQQHMSPSEVVKRKSDNTFFKIHSNVVSASINRPKCSSKLISSLKAVDKNHWVTMNCKKTPKPPIPFHSYSNNFRGKIIYQFQWFNFYKMWMN